MHLFLAYRNRAVVLETADKTPEEIGLSIDLTPEFEIDGDRALMRVLELSAVDIVDEGAITPGGLFLSAGVDTRTRLKVSKNSPDPVEPDSTMTPEEIMSAVTKAIAPYTAAVDECKAALAKLTAAPVAPDAAMKIELESLKLKAESAEKAALGAIAATAQLKKDRALLGFKGTSAEKVALASKTAEEIETLAAAKKDYLTMVAEHATTAKCAKSEAHVFVQRNHRDVYAAHLLAKGVYDPARDKMAKTAA
jgi:hypothetical protein